MANRALAALARERVARVYPLRPLQQGMLFHDLAAAGPSPYHRQVVFTLDGVVDPGRCQAAWNQVLARHPLLRALFDYQRTARPVQIVLTEQMVDFACTRGATAGDVAAWCAADRLRGFDLGADPLIRLRLFERGPGQWQLVWSHPHILLDGWSGALVLEEFAALYAGRAAELPPPGDPEPYLRALARRDDGAARAYWAGVLDGYDGAAGLPRLGPGGPPRPAGHSIAFDAAESAALAALVRRLGVTLNILVQALWGIVLGRWSDREDVVFGTVVSGRSVAGAGVERLVGMLINTLPVRVRLDHDEPFSGLLQRLQAQAQAGLAHDHLGLAEIQAAGPSRDLFDHLLVVENYPPAAPPPGLGFRVAAVDTAEAANYPFGLVVQTGAVLTITFPHDAAQFPAAQVAAVADGLRHLAAQAVAAPDMPVGRLAVGQGTVLAGPVVPGPDPATIDRLWRAQVDRSPEAIALVADGPGLAPVLSSSRTPPGGDADSVLPPRRDDAISPAFSHRTLSYRALDRAALGLAHRLVGWGVAPGQVIGVLAARGAARIIGLLAILKAGGVYLPLSPALPEARIAHMLDDTGCRLVLTDDAERVERLAPGRARPLAAAPADEPLAPRAAPDDLAYVIYTSGSTGRPKGVAVAHRGFVNMIQAQIAGFAVAPTDGVLHFASCSFDASLSEIFMALLSGARLVLAAPAAIRDGAALLAQLDADRVTVATLPPSYLRALDGAALGPLRLLITAGEPADPGDARHYARTLRYLNAYGPTEVSVCASWAEIDPGAAYPHGIPIGRLIANLVATIRDRRGRIVPDGAPGELWLGGVGLAQGYCGAADQSRFVVAEGRRWYRSGDRVRLDPAGDLLYLGRHDGQVKLRGFRIELGEVEAALAGHGAVVQAAAAVWDGRLVGYVVPRETPLDLADLRRHVAALLPAWMVPAVLLPLAALPRTLAGKLDRPALPPPGPAASAVEGPLDGTLGIVAAAFSAVLGPGPWHRHSSFRDAGGDSLKAIRLLGQLRRAGLAVDLRAMLAADSIAAIAALAPAAVAAGDETNGAVPLTPIQAWFLRSHDRGHQRLNHLVLLRCPAPLEAARLDEALDRLWRHHDALRLTCRRQGGTWHQAIAPAGPAAAAEQVDLRGAEDPWAALEGHALALQDRFDLANGPLFKAVRYCLDEGDHLLLTAHHLCVDAVSWRILLEDLWAGLAGHALPAKTSSYRTWALALAAWACAAADAERAYWAAIAETAVPALPVDGPRQPHGYGATTQVELDLGPAPAEPDSRLVARLLAALARALADWDGRQIARVMLSSHGRNPPVAGLDVSRTVGWFTADFPVLLRPQPVAAIEAMLAAVPSRGLGWGALTWAAPTPLVPPPIELGLGFLGQTDGTPGRADHGTGFALIARLPSAVIGAMARQRLIELSGEVRGGRLRLGLRYAPAIHKDTTMARLGAVLAAAYHAELGETTP